MRAVSNLSARPVTLPRSSLKEVRHVEGVDPGLIQI